MFKFSDLFPRASVILDDDDMNRLDETDDNHTLPISVRLWCYISATANFFIFLISTLFFIHTKMPLGSLTIFNLVFVIAPLNLLFRWKRTIRHLTDNVFGISLGGPQFNAELYAIIALIGIVLMSMLLNFALS